MKTLTKSVSYPAAKLVENEKHYPRTRIEITHVHDLARALKVGAEMPPIVADRETLEVVDGTHRRRAYLLAFGEKAKAPVEWRMFKDAAARLEASIDLNARHGLRYCRQDEIRCTILAEKFGLGLRELAIALQVDEERVRELAVRVVICEGAKEPAKRVASHLYGTAISISKSEATMGFSSVTLMQHVSQLRRVISSRLFDAKDERVVAALAELRDEIEKALK